MFNLAGGDLTNSHSANSWPARADAALAPTSWVLLTCNEDVMDRVIQRTLGIKPALVVGQSYGAYGAEPSLCAAARSQVDHAVRECGIRNFIVCGHSFCSAIPSANVQPLPDLTSRGYAGLVEGVRQREIANRRAREMVVRQLLALQQYLSCDHGLDPRQFLVEGVFYLRESGVLTIYEHAHERFVASTSLDAC